MTVVAAARRAVWIGLAIAAICGAAYTAREPILTSIGSQLVHADPLARADAIVVLSGGTPEREIEAADLYLAGYAPRVAVIPDSEPPGTGELRRRGVAFDSSVEHKRRLLRGLGVPESAMIVLDGSGAESTKQETTIVRDWVAANHVDRIIVVTSSFHSGRASLVFNRALKASGVQVLVRPASHDNFRASDWWRHRVNLRNALFEWQKLLFYYVAYW